MKYDLRCVMCAKGRCIDCLDLQRVAVGWEPSCPCTRKKHPKLAPPTPREQAILTVVNIIYEQNWRQDEESWDYSDDSAYGYHAALDPAFDVKPVAKKIIEALESIDWR